jgi:hypothetical protein
MAAKTQTKRTPKAEGRKQSAPKERSHEQQDSITRLANSSTRAGFFAAMQKEKYTNNSIAWYWSKYATAEHKAAEKAERKAAREKKQAEKKTAKKKAQAKGQPATAALEK